MATKMRLKEMRWIKASDLKANPHNWRQHPQMQRTVLQGLLDEVGFADVLLAYEDGDDVTLVDGHLRMDVMGDEMVPVGILDVTATEADKILATLDPLAGLAITDEETLQGILDGLEFNTQEITDMLAEILAPDYGDLPSLDDLEDQYGGGAEDDFWVPISLRVPRDVKDMFDSLMDAQDAETDAMKLKALLLLASGD
jgi:hypothetical protein